MKTVISKVRWLVVLCVAGTVASQTQLRAASIGVTNPSFESDAVPGGAGYTPTITGWTQVGPHNGINNAGGPFVAGTNIPDNANAAFVQNYAPDGNPSVSLSQTISGLDTTKQYWAQVFYDARGGNSPTLNVSYGSQALASMSVASTSNFKFLNIPFTPTASSGALSFANNNNSGDNTLLIDGISVIQRSANQVVIANPSFEGSQSPGNGYSNAIAGWTTAGRTGVNNGSQPFANNGTPPDGGQVALLQHYLGDAVPVVPTLSQQLPNLTPGNLYDLQFYYNSRGDSGIPTLTATLGDHTIASNLAVTPVGGTSPYDFISYYFVADAGDALGPTLTFSNSSTDFDSTLLIDDVSLANVPEPTLMAALLGLAGTGLLGIVWRRRKGQRETPTAKI